MRVKCADCGCFPEDCKRSKSSAECPNCTLEECCCKVGTHKIED